MTPEQKESWLERKAIRLMEAMTLAAEEAVRPSVQFKPSLYYDKDKDRWAAGYGKHFGYGGTPDLAMHDFDRKFQSP